MFDWKASAGVAIAAAFALGGCATHHETVLVPASGLDQMGRTAIMNFDGVQIRANGDVRGTIGDMRKHVTPLEVSIYNASDHPLRLRYDQFWLVDGSGRQYAALPPFRMENGQVAFGVIEPRFVYVRFQVAPEYSGLYPGMPVTLYDMKETQESTYYNTYFPYWTTSLAGLPTLDMLRAGIPEGTISIGGRVDGFLYFQEVPASAKRVELRARLVDAANNRTFANAAFPFQTQ